MYSPTKNTEIQKSIILDSVFGLNSCACPINIFKYCDVSHSNQLPLKYTAFLIMDYVIMSSNDIIYNFKIMKIKDNNFLNVSFIVQPAGQRPCLLPSLSSAWCSSFYMLSNAEGIKLFFSVCLFFYYCSIRKF